MPPKLPAPIVHINEVLDSVEPGCARAIGRHLDKCGQDLPDLELAALVHTGSISARLSERITADYHKLYNEVMAPYLLKAYNRAGTHALRRVRRRPPERPEIWRKRSDRFVSYMRREQERALMAMARAQNLLEITRVFGYEFFKAAYGLLAQDCLRAMRTALLQSRFIEVQKADEEAMNRILSQMGSFRESAVLDPEEIEAEQKRRKFAAIKAVKKLKREREKLIAAEENTRAFQEGRWVSEQELRQERAEIERLLAAERSYLRRGNVYITEPVEVPPEFQEPPADGPIREPEPEEPERIFIVGSERWEVWMTMLPLPNVCNICAPMHEAERRVDTDPPEGWGMGRDIPPDAPREASVHILCRCSSFFRTLLEMSDGSFEHYPEWDEYTETWGTMIVITAENEYRRLDALDEDSEFRIPGPNELLRR